MLWPESEEGHTGELCLAPFGESHLPPHFSTYMLGPRARFGGIPVLRRSFPPENGGLCAPAGLPPLISPLEVPPMYVFIGLGLFRP